MEFSSEGSVQPPRFWASWITQPSTDPLFTLILDQNLFWTFQQKRMSNVNYKVSDIGDDGMVVASCLRCASPLFSPSSLPCRACASLGLPGSATPSSSSPPTRTKTAPPPHATRHWGGG